MTITFRLITYGPEKANGFPLVIKLTHKGKQLQHKIAYCSKKHWIAQNEMISDKHPEYEILAQKILDIKLKARKLILRGANDVDVFLSNLFSEDVNSVKFIDFGDMLVADMEKLAAEFGKNKDLKSQNKLLGNIKVYKNVITQFRPIGENVNLVALDGVILQRFKNYQLGIGNAKPTVHQYLRTLRAIYNKGIARYKLFDEKPFASVFSGLGTKSYSSKKKYILRDHLVQLEQAELSLTHRKYIDFWLLAFYFGGCDLMDLYYLKKFYFKRDRVFFERSKTDTGLLIDLKVHPKAKKIIDKYSGGTDEYLFPFKKDKSSYESFRSSYGKYIKSVQQKLQIDVHPVGGHLGVKVARHTFATLAKQMLIHEDIIRELMGHERNEVDNFYKDKFPEKMRDDALYGIISSFECKE
jgi:hypothetical protein